MVGINTKSYIIGALHSNSTETLEDDNEYFQIPCSGPIDNWYKTITHTTTPS